MQAPLQHQEKPSFGGSKKVVGNKNLLGQQQFKGVNFKLLVTSILA
jgi:hypothetical protein